MTDDLRGPHLPFVIRPFEQATANRRKGRMAIKDRSGERLFGSSSKRRLQQGISRHQTCRLGRITSRDGVLHRLQVLVERGHADHVLSPTENCKAARR
jgi:hypothetical protein